MCKKTTNKQTNENWLKNSSLLNIYNGHNYLYILKIV